MSIDYQLLIDEAMLSIVRKVLINTSESGLIGEQSFYISFKTDDPEVVLSRNMRNKYPKEITIVLQYQFRDLQVLEDRFSVNIAFGGAAETIIVPFSVLTSFIDPVANFSLQFNRGKENVELESETFAADFDSDKEIKRMKPKLATKTKAFPKDKVQKAGEVIAIDKFRKKKQIGLNLYMSADTVPFVEIYTDGACANNPGPGGWGALLIFNDKRKEIFGYQLATTNNQMELAAAIYALQHLKKPCRVKLYTDSIYVQKGATEWMQNWQKNNWRKSDNKPVTNVDLWQNLQHEMEKHDIIWCWVKGHANNEGNNIADKLAVFGKETAKRMLTDVSNQ